MINLIEFHHISEHNELQEYNDCLKKEIKQQKPNKRSVYCDHQPSIMNLSFNI